MDTINGIDIVEWLKEEARWAKSEANKAASEDRYGDSPCSFFLSSKHDIYKKLAKLIVDERELRKGDKR